MPATFTAPTLAASAAPSAQANEPEQLYLGRLSRLLRLDAAAGLSQAERRMVRHAIFQTYRDCCLVGCATFARTLLGLQQQPHLTSSSLEVRS